MARVDKKVARQTTSLSEIEIGVTTCMAKQDLSGARASYGTICTIPRDNCS